MQSSGRTSQFQAWLEAVDKDPRAQYTTGGKIHIADAPIEDTIVDTVHKKVHFTKRAALETSLQWKQLETGHKVNAGMAGACALLSAFGSVSAASRAVAHDENGKAHVQWSQVGIALLQGAIAAGLAYSAHESLQGRSAF